MQVNSVASDISDITELRASAKRKKSRVNVLLKPITEAEHRFTVLVKKGEKYREYEIAKYFSDALLAPTLLSPFSFLPSRCLEQKYLVQAYPRGGGLSSQAKAITLALSQALLNYYPEIKSALRGANLLTKDSRVKERKKIGKYKARRAPQFTKR